jgi:uncharacterized protein (TIGR02145 family)
MNRLRNNLGIILLIILFHSCEDKPVLPSLTTKTVSEISITTAISGGTITDDGGAQIVTGGVCWNTSDDPTTENSRTIEGGDLSSFTSNITQLSPNTTYYLRAYATNSVGTGYGKSVSFKTLGDKPSSSNLNASNITTTSASLNSSVNANLLSTTVTFEYGVTSGYGSIATVPQNPVSGNSNVNVSSDLTGLTPGTTYHFRIKTENSLGKTYSSDMTFTTLGKIPDVTILAASDLQVKTATISGSVNPNYLTSTVTFEWGTTTNYGNSITPAQSPVNGSTATDISTNLTGLIPGTTYHFRIKATNALGTSTSNDLTFTTLGQIPSATTQPVTNLQVTQVRINGLVNPHYLPTEVIFEWGTTTSYGNNLSLTQNPVEGNTPVNVFTDLLGLAPETTYHYRIKATNELGTTIGDDMAFKTYGAIDIENNGYKTVTIGTQTWFSENLKSSKYNNGDIIETTSSEDIANESYPKYQWIYNGNEGWTNIAGRYYTWYAATDSRNICPTGWHVPTAEEFHSLIYYLYINGYGYEGTGWDIAKTLASTFGWREDMTPGNPGNDQATNNITGFTAIPAGFHHLQILFMSTGQNAIFWTSSLKDEPDAFVQQLGFQYGTVALTYYNKKNGLSVRCLKD